MKKLRCPVCGKGPLRHSKVDETFPYQSRFGTVVVKAVGVPTDVCPECGERFLGPRSAGVRNRAIAQAIGLLLPEQIQEVRKRWRLSKASFAKMTGIAAEDLTDWEKGRLLPSRAFDNYLRLLDHPDAQFIFKQTRAG